MPSSNHFRHLSNALLDTQIWFDQLQQLVHSMKLLTHRRRPLR
jgi:hypothetical protein